MVRKAEKELGGKKTTDKDQEPQRNSQEENEKEKAHWRGDIEKVEHLYRNLKVNYEEKKDFQRMSDFHYGEMEMYRMGHPWRRRFPLSWHNLYWFLSGYGERPLRAGILVGIFFLAFTWLIGGTGLKIEMCGNDATFGETARFVFEKATLQRPDWANPVTVRGQWLAALIVIILPGQLALFFLALRNRLGRRR